MKDRADPHAREAAAFRIASAHPFPGKSLDEAVLALDDVLGSVGDTCPTGARFPSIERLANAVEIDPAELYTSNLPSGSLSRGAFGEISAHSSLPEPDLVWVSALLDIALRRREHHQSHCE
jgi:hypothetical protein